MSGEMEWELAAYSEDMQTCYVKQDCKTYFYEEKVNDPIIPTVYVNDIKYRITDSNTVSVVGPDVVEGSGTQGNE